MLIKKLICGFGHQSRVLTSVSWKYNIDKSFYRVDHNQNRRSAVLTYTLYEKVMDVRSVSVPSKQQGQGIARLLVEAAFTYAILNGYFMILTCTYAQKYFLATKTRDLEQRVIGPSHILEKSSINPDEFFELPEPDDSDLKKK